MKVEQTRVLRHENLHGGYRLICFETPTIASNAKPGQFVHLRVPRLSAATLRRPFSIYDCEDSTLSVIYKCVGAGTAAMQEIALGENVDLMGPLGNGFPLELEGKFPVLVAGGYGVAPLYLLAKMLDTTGLLLVGGAAKDDILCIDDFELIDWETKVATEDGSLGTKGLVTGPLNEWLKETDKEPMFFACGPDGLLKAVGEIAQKHNATAWLSLDKHMGCGVGACLACVQNIIHNDGTTEILRVCKEGPVFESRKIAW